MTIKEFEIQLALGTLSLDIKRELAYSKRTPKKVLTILSTDENWGVRYWVAKNPSTPVEVLAILSTDENWGIRFRAAKNLNTPVEVAVKL